VFTHQLLKQIGPRNERWDLSSADLLASLRRRLLANLRSRLLASLRRRLLANLRSRLLASLRRWMLAWARLARSIMLSSVSLGRAGLQHLFGVGRGGAGG